MIQREDLKNAYARWATGVTVVTTRAGDCIHGMTVSAFTEVSLDPPLVLVCIDETSETRSVISESKVFAVNILERGQADLSMRFAAKEDEDRRFSGVDYQTGVTGAPLLAGTVANLDCRLMDTHEVGDHFIFIGEVVALQLFDGEPLMFHDRTYRGLAS